FTLLVLIPLWENNWYTKKGTQKIKNGEISKEEMDYYLNDDRYKKYIFKHWASSGQIGHYEF
ncbi:unnamed protein product, partial [marine sediment metagenome]